MLIPCAAGAQSNGAKRPMTFSDLMAMKRVSDPQISPSGNWVLFSVTDVSLEKNSKVNHLWVVRATRTAGVDPSGGGERQVTSGSGESNGRFSPDGKSVMYSADGQIAVAPWDDAAGMIGAGHAVTSLETGAGGAIWAPDSKHFVFVSSVYPECESKAAGAHRFEEEASCNAQKDAAAAKSPVKAEVWDHLLYRHWDHYVGAKHSHIFYVSVDGGVPEDLTPASVVADHEAPTFSLGGPLGYAISPDGKEIAYEVNLDTVPAESTNNDIFALQVGAAPQAAKKVSTSLGSDDGPAYSPDGKWLAWRSQARAGFESDLFRLVMMDRATGKITDLMPGLSDWVDEFTWGPDSSFILFASPHQGEEQIRFVATDEIVAGSGKYETGTRPESGEFSDLRIVPNSGIVAVRMTVDHPSDVVLIPKQVYDKSGTFVGGRVMVSLTHLNDKTLDRLDLSKMETFWFDGANGTKVQGFIVRPPNFDAAKKYPVKFLMHGGPQTAWGDAWSYRWNAELFAANGYVVVTVNRRGSTGYGQKFVDEVSGDWGGRAYVDLMKGLDYAETTYPFIDKNRECALGASYGGFMADWVLTHTDRFKCIVTHDGMYNPQGAFGTTEELWFNEWEFRPLVGAGPDAVVEQTKPAHPWDFYDKPANEDPFRKWSPMLFIKNAVTPTLVIHSQRDYRLDVSEGLQLFTALQLRGVPSEMLYFPDEGHWVLKPQNSQVWNETVNDWCDRWTGTNKYAAVGPEKNPAAKSAKP